jgi:hypothetical protein
MRKLPVITYMNKLDREGLDPLALLDEVSKTLNLKVAPLTWPIGMGREFVGVVDVRTREVHLFEGGRHGTERVLTRVISFEQAKEELGADRMAAVEEQLELLEIAGDVYTTEGFLSGHVSPVFWGSAMSNFGVEPLLRFIAEHAAQPAARHGFEKDGAKVVLGPADERFSGFIFKIQANMNPKHRDRLAFMRVVSGRFERGMDVFIGRSGEVLRLSKPHTFMAQERSIVEEAFPGDIVGLYDPGKLRIGDTLSTAAPLRYDGIPRFAPEHFARMVLKDPLKRPRAPSCRRRPEPARPRGRGAALLPARAGQPRPLPRGGRHAAVRGAQRAPEERVQRPTAHLVAAIEGGASATPADVLLERATLIAAPNPSAYLESQRAPAPPTRPPMDVVNPGPDQGDVPLPPPPPAELPMPQLKVLSYNTGLLDRKYPSGHVQMPEMPARFAVMPERILTDGWDVLLLQEVWENEAVDTLRAAAETHGYVVYAGSDKHHPQHGLVIIVKKSLIGEGEFVQEEHQFRDQRWIERFPGPNIKRGWLEWELTLATGQRVRLYNTHAQSFAGFWPVRERQYRELGLDVARCRLRSRSSSAATSTPAGITPTTSSAWSTASPSATGG